MNEVPKTVTQTVWIGFDPDYQTPADARIYASDMSSYGDIMLGSVEITVPVPQVDPGLKQLEALEAKRQKILADSQHALDRVDEKIAKLRAITHEPEQSDA